MSNFLTFAVNTILAKHAQNKLANICIVIPTKRGAQMFKQMLAQKLEKPILAPQVLAIDDFIFGYTKQNIMEPLALIFELFNAYKKVNPAENTEFFMSWAPVLLKDFETIDQYLVKVKPLFKFISEAKAMERWGMTTMEENKVKESAQRYYDLFDKLFKVYIAFNEQLTAKGYSYRGAAYRKLAYETQQLILDNTNTEHFYFLGFNALSKAEFTIVKKLQKANKATMIFDWDSYYMSKSEYQMAGHFLKYYNKFNYFNKVNPIFDLLCQSPKNIHIVETGYALAQVKTAFYYLEKWQKEDPSQSLALVLADENLLSLVLSNVPESLNNMNITMGLSLKNAQIYTLMEQFLDLHYYRAKNGSYNSKILVNILKNSHIQSLCLNSTQDFNTWINALVEKRSPYVKKNDIIKLLNDHPIAQLLASELENNALKIIDCLIGIIKIIDQNGITDKIEQEFTNALLTNIMAILEVLKNEEEILNLPNFRKILNDFSRQTKLPFTGQGTAGIQIMGMLETRTLDFDKIVMLSVNEGTIPTGNSQNSLIPYDAKKILGLPLHDQQDAITAYHFYRLLQRCSEVTMVYSSTKAIYGIGGKSRFIIQIEEELSRLNPKIVIDYPTFSFNYELQKEQNNFKNEVILKTDFILESIKNLLEVSGLSATSINTYMACGMKFYLQRILKIGEEEENNEIIASDTLGTWVHNTLEKIFVEYINKNTLIEKQDWLKVRNEVAKLLEKEFEISFPKLDLSLGLNQMYFKIATELIQNYFDYELEKTTFPLEIFATEMEFTHVLPIPIDNDNTIQLKLKGRIDRIDKNKEGIRVIDFKTGKVETTKTLEIASFEKKNTNEKSLQLWLYKYLIIQNILNQNPSIPQRYISNINDVAQIDTVLFSLKSPKKGFLSSAITFKELKDDNSFESFINSSNTILENMVKELLNKEINFEKTKKLNHCKYCNYATLCNR